MGRQPPTVKAPATRTLAVRTTPRRCCASSPSHPATTACWACATPTPTAAAAPAQKTPDWTGAPAEHCCPAARYPSHTMRQDRYSKCIAARAAAPTACMAMKPSCRAWAASRWASMNAPPRARCQPANTSTCPRPGAPCPWPPRSTASCTPSIPTSSTPRAGSATPGDRRYWQWAVSAFGELEPTTAATGWIRPRIGDAGLHYNHHRYYDPYLTVGYTQADPLGLAAGWNRFGYVGGNPFRFSDPQGLAISALADMAFLR